MLLSRRKLLVVGGLITLGQFGPAVTPSKLLAQVPAQSDSVQELVGETPDTPFYVAVAMETDVTGTRRRVTAYVCDGQDTSHLFRGEATDTGFDLMTEDGTAQLVGAYAPSGILGTFSGQGTASAFFAVPTRAFGGLYRTTAQDERHAVGRALEVRMTSRLSIRSQNVPDWPCTGAGPFVT